MIFKFRTSNFKFYISFVYLLSFLSFWLSFGLVWLILLILGWSFKGIWILQIWFYMFKKNNRSFLNEKALVRKFEKTQLCMDASSFCAAWFNHEMITRHTFSPRTLNKKALKSSLIFCSITHLKTVKVSLTQIIICMDQKVFNCMYKYLKSPL